MRAAAAAEQFERAAWLRRRSRRLGAILNRLGGVLEALHARPRLIVCPHPVQPKHDALWVVGGRLVDWGPLPAEMDELEARTGAALARDGRRREIGAHVPPEEIDEIRIVQTFLASHPETPQLALSPAPGRAELEGFADQLQLNGSSTTSAVTPPEPTVTEDPGSTSRRTIASAIEPRRGESTALPM
jgi:DNA polymerase-3 subunit epsilon